MTTHENGCEDHRHVLEYVVFQDILDCAVSFIL